MTCSGCGGFLPIDDLQLEDDALLPRAIFCTGCFCPPAGPTRHLDMDPAVLVEAPEEGDALDELIA